MRGPVHNVPIQRGYPISPRNLSPPPMQTRPPPSRPVYLQPPVNRPPPNYTPTFGGPSTPTFHSPPPIYNGPPIYNYPPQIGRPVGGYPIYGGPPRGVYYPFQQIPGLPRHPQNDLNMNFDYEQANFLTDTKIVENTVFCVICGENFKGSEREEHLKLHMRRPSEHSRIEGVSSILQERSERGRKHYIVKPIIEPEEHIVGYEPIVYDVVDEIVYEDPSMIATKEMGIGGDQSFSQLDPNMSVDYGRNTDIPNRRFDTEANPFTSRGSGYNPDTYGNNHLYEGNNAYNKDQNNSLSYSGTSRMQVEKPEEHFIQGDPNNLNGSSLQIRDPTINHSLISNTSKK